MQKYQDIAMQYVMEFGVNILAAVAFWVGGRWCGDRHGLVGAFGALRRRGFLIVLRPFKVGDFVGVGGLTGAVREIGLFATTLDTPDGVYTTVGNSKVFADTIQNFTTNPFRRVELKAQLAGSTDPASAAALLKERLAAIPNVLKTPAVEVEILEFNLVGPVLAVRPFCHNDHYWQVYFDSNRTIRDSFGEAGFAAPTPAQVVMVQGKLDSGAA